MAARTVPVTIISGYSGAGKSALVEHLSRALRSRRPVFIQADNEPDLLTELRTAVDMNGADLVVIETVCHAEPFLYAESLTQGLDSEPPPRGVRVDTLVTVVDASRFLQDVLAGDDLIDVVEDCDPEDDRTVSEILIEQIEYADVIVLNKTDLVDANGVSRVQALLERLNPRAKLLRATKGQVSAVEITGTGLFDLDDTDEGAGWLAELNGEFEGIEGIGEVSSFTYNEHRPFHPIRFNELLSDFDVRGLVRAKGSVWVATRHHEIGVWSLAGRASLLSYGGAWFAATPARQWPQDERERAEIMNDWTPPFGDRRQEIAFIGIEMNENEIRDRLNECLLTADEMKDGPDGWYLMPDPLPDWHVEDDVEL